MELRLQGEEVERGGRWGCRNEWGRAAAVPLSIVNFLGWGLRCTGGFKSERPLTLALQCSFLPRALCSLSLLQDWQISWGRSPSPRVPEPPGLGMVWVCRDTGLPWVRWVQPWELPFGMNAAFLGLFLPQLEWLLLIKKQGSGSVWFYKPNLKTLEGHFP